MRIWIAETLLSWAFQLVARLPDRRADAIRFTVLGYFMRWRDAPRPISVSVSERF